jgi:lipid II:glycine glycyltransferase (peptidoglycan interpeptide bridge formation enzyme)
MHLLQTAAWGDLKAAFGWSVERIEEQGRSVQILLRRFPLGHSLAYVPKGPGPGELQSLLPLLDALCRRQRAFALKIEPDSPEDPTLSADLTAQGFLPSAHEIQPRRTLVIDLRGSEEEILARMHQKTRYNVRLAARKGVSVRPWQDLAAFGSMMLATAERDRFGAHVPSYYKKAYELFHPEGACELLVAEFEGEPLASLMIFAHGARAWYLYGASTPKERNRMPTYLLQWEAMLWARERGCTSYDLWGVPDAELDTLEDQFAGRSDGLWGIYRFKRGFGGRLVRSIGAWDRPYRRTIYQLYRIATTLRRS